MAKKKTTSKKAKKAVKKTAKKVAKKAAKKAVKKITKKAVKKKVAKKASKKVSVKKAAVKKVTKSKIVSKKKAESDLSVVQKPKSDLIKPKKTVKELKGFDKKQYQKLLDLRDSILDLMHGVTHDTLKNTENMESGGGGMHSGDASSDSYDRDFALNLLAMEQDSLSEIEQAISRAEAGVYGVCEMSGERIPKERLEAIPFARYTVKCQEIWEKTSGNSRQQARESFGFSAGSMR